MGLMVLLLSLSAYSKTPNLGAWRFELLTANGAVPFILTFSKHKKGLRAVIHNGKEEIKLNEVIIKKENEISIPLQNYEISLELEIDKPDMIHGELVRHNKNPVQKTPVRGVHGNSERFLDKKLKPDIDLTGRWAVNLKDENDKEEPGIIVFTQKDNYLSGSLLTPTGDYRYMEGYISGTAFVLASFDGMYNYLFQGSVKDGILKAEIRANYLTRLTGQKNDNASLPDAYKQTEIASIDFVFPNPHGKMVALSNPQFKNKAVIVQIFGSWCPNCIDEMNFLIPWYKQNHKRGVEIIALAFERSLDHDLAKKQLLKVYKKKKVPYYLLLAGTTAEDKPNQKFPTLKNFISFPTTIFLNKKHEVVKVHAGFTGPSTGEFFEKWKVEFNENVNQILK